MENNGKENQTQTNVATSTVNKPITTNQASKPVSTTAKPASTTTKPVSTVAKPTNTVSKPATLVVKSAVKPATKVVAPVIAVKHKTVLKKFEYSLFNFFFGLGYAFDGKWQRTLIILGIVAVATIVAGITMKFSKFIPTAIYFGIFGLLGYSAFDGFKNGI